MDVHGALADPVRRDLLRRLARGPARVVDLAVEHPISRPAVSRHLRVLEEAGLVTAEDRGRERHFALVPEGLRPVEALLRELRGAFTDHALAGPDLEVRRTGGERRADATRTADHGEETA